METLFISRQARLRQKENTLAVKLEGRTQMVPIEKIAHIILLAESDLNSRLLVLCGKHNVRISIFDYYGYYKGSFEPIDKNPSGMVKLKQAGVLLNDHRRMALAREIVRGATHNMIANLRYYNYRGISELKPLIEKMQRLATRIDKSDNSETLMGIEGNLHQHYYAAWPLIDPQLDFTPRVRRPPNNPVNCLISFLNQLTYSVVRHELSKTHLETSFSLLHAPGSGRASLALDLAEPFKPMLTDMLIFRMIRKNMVDKNWFEQQDNVCLLSETGRRHIAEQFSKRLEERLQERTIREWIYREALAIERDILDVAEYESFKRRV